MKIDKVSAALGVSFSAKFSKICEFARFDVLDSFDGYNFDRDDDYSVISSTLRLRESMGLPHNVLFLAEDDASLWFMKCFGDHEEIFWIRIEDGENFCQGKLLEYDYDHFPTFEAFFEFLLDEEEKMRKEEAVE